MKPIDDFLDQITMYRLVFYYLGALLLAALGLSAAGVLSFSPEHLVLSTGIIFAVCYMVNKAFAWFLNVPANAESTYITAFILALIIPPMSGLEKYQIGFILAASGLAIASKYVFNLKNKHIFNPAALAVAMMALGPKQGANWWVGASALLPVVLVGGFLVVRKLRRWTLVLSFFASALLATALYNVIGHHSLMTAFHTTFTDSALFFLGFVMLTEPQTMPPTRGKQAWYGVLVGLLFPPQAHILSFYFTPELALVTGNIFSYFISPKERYVLRLLKQTQKTPDITDFAYKPDQKLKFIPGQYMEFTLAHPHADNRGVRRYLTVASSPTEPDLHLGVKFYTPSSTFKKAMRAMETGEPIVGGQMMGDFVLPKDANEKVVFITGGIGVTPFRSMTKYLTDTKQKRSISMLYAARSVKDFAYFEVFEEARSAFGMETTYFVDDAEGKSLPNHVREGRITVDLIKELIPDYMERTFYLSGTHHMVMGLQSELRAIGVPAGQVKIDFFPGYV